MFHVKHPEQCFAWNILLGYYCTYINILALTAYETTETGYSAAAGATEDFAAAGFGGGGRRSADATAAEAAIIQGAQEADYVVSGCRRSGMVQKSWTGVPDADQSCAVGGDEGREEDVGGMRIIGIGLKTPGTVKKSRSHLPWSRDELLVRWYATTYPRQPRDRRQSEDSSRSQRWC